jgi:site-specific DNA-methyltransferase (adenine-specific)
MKPRHEKFADCDLYLGDCLDILPGLSGVDAVITDPPYSSGGRTAGERRLAPHKKYQNSTAKTVFADFYGDNRDQRSWERWMYMWLSAALATTKPGAMVCIFTDWRQLPSLADVLQWAGAVWRGVAVWDKGSAARPQPNRFRQQAEFICWGTNGARKADSKDKSAVYLPGVFASSPVPNNQRLHMTQKPLPVMLALVQSAPPGGVVLDPFMGSGTTGVACIRQGRKFIGVEITEHYFDVACRRLENETKTKKEP